MKELSRSMYNGQHSFFQVQVVSFCLLQRFVDIVDRSLHSILHSNQNQTYCMVGDCLVGV